MAVVKTYDLTLWLLEKVEKFPRSHRMSVGDRIVQSSLDLLLALVEAAYASDRSVPLARASREVNALRYLLRLAKDLRLIAISSHEFASERLDEVGRMVGGWVRSRQGPPASP